MRTGTDSPFIGIEGLTKVYRSRVFPEGLLALDGISFTVQSGEFVCLLGPSGCGKTTILNILGGLDTDYAGQARVGTQALRSGNDSPIQVGYVFQESRLLPWLSVRGNVHFALESVGVPRQEWERRTEAWLDRVGLAGFGDAHPHELSGGMQQRASIARAFAVDPEVLLVDEPFSGLDELTARTMRQQIIDLWHETRKTVLFVTHNCLEACYLADRILVLSRRPGRIREDVRVGVPRPRDYESPQLFAQSVEVTRLLLATEGGSGS